MSTKCNLYFDWIINRNTLLWICKKRNNCCYCYWAFCMRDWHSYMSAAVLYFKKKSLSSSAPTLFVSKGTEPCQRDTDQHSDLLGALPACKQRFWCCLLARLERNFDICIDFVIFITVKIYLTRFMSIVKILLFVT